ncbi:LuxR C-terminal-related transcriptional regulator [Nitrosomonas communis]|uniref:RNA polymerase sigma factor, sigma-70 family n=1 Tax=Nitrosomonas communis TaxID=44574 RepID=A0A1I4P422_9PROT|nr:response regulator transcription factor [Nitrosomonas communis]SFM22366.1 RNA polymerase sigma factor, sigma-70 family [Nitrosomonas communis]
MIIFASSSEDKLTHWKQGLSDISTLYCLTNPDTLRNELIRRTPPILLLDYDFLVIDNSQTIENMLKLSPRTRIILFSPGISDENEWKLFKAGVKGFCLDTISSEQIKRAVEAVCRGELWIRRQLVQRMQDELATAMQEKKHIERAVNNLLENLTKREYEIAILVGRGESNKQIAKRLDITERTVKAHLTEIFRKLAISDRIKLALLVKDTAATTNQVFDNNNSDYPTISA